MILSARCCNWRQASKSKVISWAGTGHVDEQSIEEEGEEEAEDAISETTLNCVSSGISQELAGVFRP